MNVKVIRKPTTCNILTTVRNKNELQQNSSAKLCAALQCFIFPPMETEIEPKITSFSKQSAFNYWPIETKFTVFVGNACRVGGMQFQ
jgi:hypothetical protein